MRQFVQVSNGIVVHALTINSNDPKIGDDLLAKGLIEIDSKSALPVNRSTYDGVNFGAPVPTAIPLLNKDSATWLLSDVATFLKTKL